MRALGLTFLVGSVHANKNAPPQQLSTVLASGVFVTAQLRVIFVIRIYYS